MRKRRIIAMYLAVGCVLLAACGIPTNTEQAMRATFGQAPNEILTYEKPEQGKIQLVVSGLGNNELIAAFEAAHPDIQIIREDITLGNDAYRPIYEWIDAGLAPDVFFAGADIEQGDTKHFSDLTAKEYTANYDAETLLPASVNGHVNLLPGPSMLSGILYNQTLFERYGWEVPHTIDEFLALCDRITADTGGQVIPFNPNAKYDKEFGTLLEAMTYDSILGGADNRAWLHSFRAGKATIAGHLEPLYAVARKLAEHGVLRPESFSDSYTARNKAFAAGKIAMINDFFTNLPQDSVDSFSVMPYPGRTSQERMLMKNPCYWVGIPKGERSDAVQQAADELLRYVSSAEGQAVFIGDQPLIGSIADAKLSDVDAWRALHTVIDEGRVATPEYFALDNVPWSQFLPITAVCESVKDVVEAKKTAAQAIASVDEEIAHARRGQKPTPAIVGTARANFTVLETSSLFADAFREKTGAQIALVLNNVTYRGNVMRIFKGDLTQIKVQYLKPRSLENGSALVSATMTGKQLRAVLDHPRGEADTPADCVYAVSGLKATYAPWNVVGTKVQAATLADGTAIDDAKQYTVAFWLGTVDPAYYDSASVHVVDGSFEDVLAGYLSAHSPITPAQDERITLVWN